MADGTSTTTDDKRTTWIKYLLDKYGPLTVGLAVSLAWVGQNIGKPVVDRHIKFLDEEIELRKSDSVLRGKEEETRASMVDVLGEIKDTNGELLLETKRNGHRLDAVLGKVKPHGPTNEPPKKADSPSPEDDGDFPIPPHIIRRPRQ